MAVYNEASTAPAYSGGGRTDQGAAAEESGGSCGFAGRRISSARAFWTPWPWYGSCPRSRKRFGIDSASILLDIDSYRSINAIAAAIVDRRMDPQRNANPGTCCSKTKRPPARIRRPTALLHRRDTVPASRPVIRPGRFAGGRPVPHRRAGLHVACPIHHGVGGPFRHTDSRSTISTSPRSAP